MSADPLASLVVDESSVAREELATTLAPYVRLTNTGGLLFEPRFDELSSYRRVVCALLAMRAAQMLGLRESPAVRPKELIALTGMPPGTVRPKLRELLRMRIVAATDGEYSIPVHATRRAAAFVGDTS